MSPHCHETRPGPPFQKSRTQSLFHDHAPANTFGLANAWIDRQRLSEGGTWGATAKLDSCPETDFVFFTMGEMADAVREATGD